MPYVSDMGAINNVDAVNQTGDRIRQSLQARDARSAAEEEQNRALHPATQKWLAKVMDGSMSAAEAAANAHAEIDAQGASLPPPDGPAGLAAMGGVSGGASEYPRASGGLRATAEAPPQPFTSRDVKDLNELAPFVSAQRQRVAGGGSLEDKIKLEEVKGGEKRKTLGMAEGGRNDRAAATLNYKEHADLLNRQAKEVELAQKRMLAIAKLNNDLDIAIRNNANHTEVEGIKAQVSLITSSRAARSREIASLMDDDRVADDTKKLLEDEQFQMDQIDKRIGNPERPPPPEAPLKPGDVGGLTKHLGVPPGAPKKLGSVSTPLAPAPETPNIPPMIPNLGVPPALPTSIPVKEPEAGSTYGAPIPDAGALPPRQEKPKEKKVDKTRTVKMKFPSGAIHDVDLADVDAMSKNKGAVVVQGTK